MKKFLILSTFGIFGVLGFMQSAIACNPSDPHYNSCVYHNIILPAQQNQPRISQAQAQAYQRALDQPIKPLPDRYHEQCQAQPSGTKLCQYIYKDTGKIGFVFETNTSGTVLYYRRYDNAGILKSESWYNNQGHRHGAFKAYHNNGKLSGESNFVNGQLQGEYKVYDENGRLIEIEHYQDDKNILEFQYANDQKHGQETQYQYIQLRQNTVQVPIRTAQWQNGIKHGEEKFFEVVNKKGKTKLVKTVMWQNGKMVSN